MNHAERMKEIKERVAKASIGPWSVQVNRAYHISFILRSAAGNKIAQFFNWQDIGFDVNSESNSNFMAHARADIPYLVARVEELEAAQKSICDAFAEWESVRTFRNDINSHEWLALVAAVTAMENSHEAPTTTD